MTEESYGGNNGISKGKAMFTKKTASSIKASIKEKKEASNPNSELDLESYRKAGEIARKIKEFARSIIKKEVKLVEIADKVENKILELGGRPAFPVNLCINEIAAHDTPKYGDERTTYGLLKIDFGVAVQGCICDVAFSLDLENNEENKKLIESSDKALAEALKVIKKDVEIYKIGSKIHGIITASGFAPIRNLSGHEVSSYQIHAGLTIPNYDNGNENKLPEGAYAIEPFSTNGQGLVYEGASSGIYRFEQIKGVRDMSARKILEFILEEYKTMPFCERWLIKIFGTKAKLSLSFLQREGIIAQYPQLIEKGKGKVSQAETTVLALDETEVLC
ncbi:MAG: type II methionyl aminopeptidase [Candidatus Pacearchaeota archaeon]|nr:type II methionyl aminopeptidase [Candidatus Pacearchaeota archaeon]MCX6747998.1 type II methionyl aminopeptidase [Candidatus Pacearchaeota archaeon]